MIVDKGDDPKPKPDLARAAIPQFAAPSLLGTLCFAKKQFAHAISYFVCYLQVSPTEFKIPTEPFQSRDRPAPASRKPPRLVLIARLRDENIVMNVFSNETLIRKRTEEPDSSYALC
jgi:hypothetical protein